MKPNRLFWKGKRVLLTGHSGFKGSWLSLILNEMGAEVVGLSLDPDTEPNLYSIIQVSQFVDENMGASVTHLLEQGWWGLLWWGLLW